MNPGDGPVPDLSRAGQVVVMGFKVYPANAVDVLASGLTDRDAPAHLRLIDIPKAEGHAAPLRTPQLRHLHEQLTALLDGE